MTSAPILTITLNPALDLSARVSRMEAGPKLRLQDVLREPGGGGVNVARVIHRLGGAVCAWVALGGATGVQHRALLQAQGVTLRAFELPVETRQSWAVTEASGAQFRLQLPGDPWPEAEITRALDDIAQAAPGLVVLSGSQPPGVPAAFPTMLAARLGSGRLIIDTSGPALLQLIAAPAAPVRVLRLDQAEAEAQAGQPLSAAQDTARFAQALRARGVAEMVCIARGADGNILADASGCLHCCPPQVPERSKIGAGDSFTGAFALALAQGRPARDALREGTAAAAATVMSVGTALCAPDDVHALAAQCRVMPLDS
ncbi:MAG: 1-phosphofructokinase family hexose kinase [Rhodobacteraceae bacterium]|nr:MAG: 1-phosphofructokinase family hexose kinase [Paracoccaceae bacterium]